MRRPDPRFPLYLVWGAALLARGLGAESVVRSNFASSVSPIFELNIRNQDVPYPPELTPVRLRNPLTSAAPVPERPRSACACTNTTS